MRLFGFTFAFSGIAMLILTAMLSIARMNDRETHRLIIEESTSSGERLVYGVSLDVHNVHYLTKVGYDEVIDFLQIEPTSIVLRELIAGGWRFHRIGLDRQHNVILTHTGWITPLFLSKDGNWLYFELRNRIEDIEILRVQPDGSHKSIITLPGKAADTWKFLDEQESVIYWSNHESTGDLYSAKLDGTAVKRLTVTGDVINAPLRLDFDGWIYFYRGTESENHQTLWRIRLDGIEAQQIAKNVIKSFSPYGADRIFYWVNDNQREQLYFALPDGTDAHRLEGFSQNTGFLEWTSDNKWLFYFEGDRHFRLNLTNGEKEEIIIAENLSYVRFIHSSLEEYLLLNEYIPRTDTYNLYRANLDGSNLQILATNIQPLSQLDTDEMLIYTREQAGINLVYKLDLKTLDEVFLVSAQTTRGFPYPLVIMPTPNLSLNLIESYLVSGILVGIGIAPIMRSRARSNF